MRFAQDNAKTPWSRGNTGQPPRKAQWASQDCERSTVIEGEAAMPLCLRGQPSSGFCRNLFRLPDDWPMAGPKQPEWRITMANAKINSTFGFLSAIATTENAIAKQAKALRGKHSAMKLAAYAAFMVGVLPMVGKNGKLAQTDSANLKQEMADRGIPYSTARRYIDNSLGAFRMDPELRDLAKAGNPDDILAHFTKMEISKESDLKAHAGLNKVDPVAQLNNLAASLARLSESDRNKVINTLLPAAIAGAWKSAADKDAAKAEKAATVEAAKAEKAGKLQPEKPATIIADPPAPPKVAMRKPAAPVASDPSHVDAVIANAEQIGERNPAMAFLIRADRKTLGAVVKGCKSEAAAIKTAYAWAKKQATVESLKAGIAQSAQLAATTNGATH
jgi:hypothetical protein